jgi:hypothetical protein
MVIEILDLTRGLNSLALYHWTRSNGHKFKKLRCFSGFGEPEWIAWESIIQDEINHLAKFWVCDECGREIYEKERQPCPGCENEAENLTPGRVDWGGISKWKLTAGRLTFRFSAHPF